jgi:ketosteroid isomerase-like protein
VSNADLLRGNYARIAAPGGMQEIARTLHPEHELREFSAGEPVRVHKGRDGFFKWARQGMITFSDTTMEPVDFEEHGDTVLVTLEVKATAGGEPLDMLVHHVVEMRDGLIWRTSSYLDAAQARAEAGFPPNG